MNIDTICALLVPLLSFFSVSGSLGIQHVGKQFISKVLFASQVAAVAVEAGWQAVARTDARATTTAAASPRKSN